MFTRQIRKQLAKNIERVIERGKNTRQALYFYSPILNSTRIWRVGEWLSAPLLYKISLFNAFIDEHL
jgi:hypothetical protein